MSLESTNNNPPSIRTNADGRITNMDDILANIEIYSVEELDTIRWTVREALKKADWHLRSLHEEYKKHQINVGDILAWIQMARRTSMEWRIAEVWDPEEVIASYTSQVSEILAGSTLRTLIIDDQERYTNELCALAEAIIQRINRWEN